MKTLLTIIILALSATPTFAKSKKPVQDQSTGKTPELPKKDKKPMSFELVCESKKGSQSFKSSEKPMFDGQSYRLADENGNVVHAGSKGCKVK